MSFSIDNKTVSGQSISETSDNTIVLQNKTVADASLEASEKALVFPEFDKGAALKQLELLGYQPGDKVCLSVIDPVKGKTIKLHKPECKYPDLPWNNLQKYQKQGYGVYFVFNGNSWLKDEIDLCRAIAYEHDQGSIDYQIESYKEVGLPKPSFQVFTGGKSIHNYWVLEKPVNREPWTELQKDIIAVFKDSPDKSICKANQLMRLAGFWHIDKKTGNANQIASFVSSTSKRYDFEELRSIIPQRQTKAKGVAKQLELPKEEVIDQEQTLSEFVVDKVYSKLALEEAFNWSGHDFKVKEEYKLKGSCPWHDSQSGTSFYCERKADGRLVYYCPACDIGGDLIHYRERLKGGIGTLTGQSFVNAVIELAAEVDVYDIPQPQYQGDKKDNQSNEKIESRDESKDIDFVGKIDQLIELGLHGSELQRSILLLSEETNIKCSDLKSLYDQKVKELETTLERDINKAEVSNLIEVRDKRFDISDFLPFDIAELFKQVAYSIGCDPESLLTLFIPTAASLVKTNSRIKLAESWNDEPFIFYTCLVSDSGNRKTPTFNVVTAPVRQLQKEASEQYKLLKEMYEYEYKQWKANGSDPDNEPQDPAPMREFFVDDFTMESLAKIKDKQPDKGLVILKDELSGFFGSLGAYKGGRGSDFESFLQMWNGKGIKVNRANGSVIFIDRDSTSLTGGIQPSKLRELMGNLEDSQGGWARFLWYYAPRRPFKLNLNQKTLNITGFLHDIYTQIDSLPEMIFEFDRGAQEVFENWYNSDYEKLLDSETHPGLKAAISKLPGYLARLSGMHHVLTMAVGYNAELKTTITSESVEAALKLLNFYYSHLLLIHSESHAEKGELNPKLAKILTLATEKGSLTIREAMRAFGSHGKREEVLKMFKELEEMAYGRVEQNKNSIKFLPKANQAENQ